MYLLLACFLPPLACGQSDLGELRLQVEDPSGLGLVSSVSLVSQVTQVQEKAQTDSLGRFVRHNLPFGMYVLNVSRPGFATYSSTLQVASRVPLQLRVRLPIQSANSEVVVRDQTTLVDPQSTGTVVRVGRASLDNQPGGTPGRSVINVVASQPGWVLESNASLHPRGSENQVQYVLDGLPLTENRSPAFSAGIDADDIQSVAVLTGNIPAEYGRKLGGIIELNSRSDLSRGFHGEFSAAGGSFRTGGAYGAIGYGSASSAISVSAHTDATARYLDPPVLENFTNHGRTNGEQVRYQRDLTAGDRLTLSVTRDEAGFQIPNEYVQQFAGQSQSRTSEEIFGSATYEHVISQHALADVRVMFRDLSAALTSNQDATPVIASQRRESREAYLKSTVSIQKGVHDVKAGIELDYSPLRERFAYQITDSSFFDPSTPQTFSFHGRGTDREEAAFVQDGIHVGQWSVSLGLRYDHHNLLVNRWALSPRLGVARYWPGATLKLHASYDRVFQTPASENILLSSSASVASLDSQVLRLPVQPSFGNYWDLGFSKGIFGALKLDVDGYRRSFSNYADDDLLLNTGVSFPISFRKGTVYGAEAKLELPRWKRFSSWASYSYMVGFAYPPVTGGLLLGSEAGSAVLDTARFPVTQDQRNTIAFRGLVQLPRRFWIAAGAAYGSGLPTEFEGTYADAVQQYGKGIADRVDFSRGRVRPSLAVNASLGADLYRKDKISVSLQADAENLNNRLNLINFAGLFSGTGIGMPRSYAVRIRTTF